MVATAIRLKSQKSQYPQRFRIFSLICNTKASGIVLRHRYIALLLLFAVCSQSSLRGGGTVPRSVFQISIAQSFGLDTCTGDAARLQALLSASPAARQYLGSLPLYAFHPAFPGSHYQYLRSIYDLVCDSQPAARQAIFALHSADPAAFAWVREKPVATALGGTYYPNDYHGVAGADCSGQLDYINAPAAWGITHGNPKVVIGINDPSGFDIHHPDLAGKIVSIDSFNFPSFHGTLVAGCAAAHTDNGIGVAGIGFNCSLALNSQGGDAVCLSMSQAGIRVINNSWFYGATCTPVYEPAAYSPSELVYDEVYENGTSTCFAAGNGLSGDGHCPSIFSYPYPGVLDHIINVGAIGWQNPPGYYADWAPAQFPPGGIPWLWKDCHEESPGYATGQYNTLNYQANNRVDICAPAYNVVSTFYNPNDSAQHYVTGACGTSFASPMVAGAIGLMLSANPCLSPYQVEYLLKTTARSTDFVEYPPGSGINLNRDYVGKMGAGALDAGKAVAAAAAFDCNDTASQTMYIEGIELNTVCAPGYSPLGVLPVLKPVVRNGQPPFSYRWDPLPGNTCTLDDYTSAAPTITGGTFAQFRLGVYDASQPVPKEASKLIQLSLSTAQQAMLSLRDSYMDMGDEPNSQASVNSYNSQLWLSPDLVNRLADDLQMEHQQPVYAPGQANYATVRLRNLGCLAGSGSEWLDLSWSLAGTAQNWPGDWTTATFTNAASGAKVPAGGKITASPIRLPRILPGEALLLSAPWYPPDPAAFDSSLKHADLSLLGRIGRGSTAPFGMDQPELGNTNVNATANRSIALHSLVVNASGGPALQWHLLFLANPDSADRLFSIEAGSDRDLHPSYSGDLSVYLRAEVKLGVLFDRWVAGGEQGSNAVVDAKNKSLAFTGNGKVVLSGMMLHAGEKLPVWVGMLALQPPLADQYFHLRQWAGLPGSSALPYGSQSFLLPACSGANCSTTAHPGAENSALSQRLNVYPVPVQGQLNILYGGLDENSLSYVLYDLSGQQLSAGSAMQVSYGTLNSIDVSMLGRGLYFLKVYDAGKATAVFKIVKD